MTPRRRRYEIATRKDRRADRHRARLHGNLVRICAECGEFDDAVSWQEKAIELAPEAAAEEFRARAELYRDGKPYRTAK